MSAMVDRNDDSESLLALYTPSMGCALVLAAANTGLMGLLALTLAFMSYSSVEQMI